MIERESEFGVSVHQLSLKDALRALEDAEFVRMIRISFESFHQANHDGLPFNEWLAETIVNQRNYFALQGQDPLTNVSFRMITAVKADYQNYPGAVANTMENKNRPTIFSQLVIYRLSE